MEEDRQNSDYATIRSQSPSVDSQAYAIPMPEEIVNQLSEGSSVEGSESSGRDGSCDDLFLDRVVPETSNAFFMDSQDPGPMLDVSKYIFESLVQAIDAADFAEAISLQTKTSAVINSKSMELKQLIEATKIRLSQFKERFERGAQTSRIIRHNLQYSKERIDRINAAMGTEFPIEFNQAREKVLERQYQDNSDEMSNNAT